MIEELVFKETIYPSNDTSWDPCKIVLFKKNPTTKGRHCINDT